LIANVSDKSPVSVLGSVAAARRRKRKVKPGGLSAASPLPELAP